MQIAQPLFQFLLYLALWFAPPEAEQILVTGPGAAAQLSRAPAAEGVWLVSKSNVDAVPAGARLLLGGDAVLTQVGERWAAPVALAEWLRPLALGTRAWAAGDGVELSNGWSLRRLADGLEVRVSSEAAAATYRVRFLPAATERAQPTVQVLGAVARPGAYELSAGAGLGEALAAAGGLKEGAPPHAVRLLRGGASQALPLVPGSGAALVDEDIVYVPGWAPVVAPVASVGAKSATAGGSVGAGAEAGAALGRAEAVRQLTAAAASHARLRRGRWPQNLAEMRGALRGTPLGGGDDELMRLARLFSYRAPDAERGAVAAAVAVVFELQPAHDGQWVGFSDETVAWVQDGERLRALGAPRAAGERLALRWAGQTERVPVDFLSPLALDSAAGGARWPVECEQVLTGADVESAERGQSTAGGVEVVVKLRESGKRKLAESTAGNLGRRLAIVWEGRVLSAPMVMQPITSDRVSVTGRFSETVLAGLLEGLNGAGGATREP